MQDIKVLTPEELAATYESTKLPQLDTEQLKQLHIMLSKAMCALRNMGVIPRDKQLEEIVNAKFIHNSRRNWEAEIKMKRWYAEEQTRNNTIMALWKTAEKIVKQIQDAHDSYEASKFEKASIEFSEKMSKSMTIEGEEKVPNPVLVQEKKRGPLPGQKRKEREEAQLERFVEAAIRIVRGENEQ